ncbi:C40 family peptidase [Streptomyces beijiangensis]|uniref:C40 family peptidase n=1 Tax=Streptomyces beijiangensis TaxID=163361 RepID=A0A939JKM6_9ACTN|nr:C40 family peptidase [Streptomyces beijiangensis]MBO0515450.1 C40 family peptidase [Streptomyces beijiangensis]
MADHRKPRTRIRAAVPAVSLTTAALASVSLLTQSAQAAPVQPKPSIEDVQKKVDDLYRQAGTETQKYDRAKESTALQRKKVDKLLDAVAKRTEQLNESRRELGQYAAAQYRGGPLASTATMLLADDPQSYFDQNQMMKQVSAQQTHAVDDYTTQQKAAAKQRGEATAQLETLASSQAELKATKEQVQSKLGETRELLSKLTAEEKARLAALEKARQKAAAKKAAELAAKQAAAEKAAKAAAAKKPGSGSSTPTTGSSGSYSAKAAKVLAFARAQMGKPYVWGATGPSSYDCSGLTQAAWKAAGIDLPRTTWDQVKVGTRVATADLQPGDLVFFYDDISHVGIYIGGGKMIHAPHTGANVREESIYYMPIYGSVRPA